MRILLLSAVFFSNLAWGWGDDGHRLITRIAARLIGSHPVIQAGNLKRELGAESLSLRFSENAESLATLSNVPDEWTKNPETKEKSGPTHYLDLEWLWRIPSVEEYRKSKFPLDIKKATEFFEAQTGGRSLTKDFGTLPWRTQQFTRRLLSAFEKAAPKKGSERCDEKRVEATKEALTEAALLAHFIEDATQPLHATKDFDGHDTGQRGMHLYVEVDLVKYLINSDDLQEKVLAETMARLSKERQLGERWVGVMFLILLESHDFIDKVRDLDLKYAVAPYSEGKRQEICKALESYAQVVKLENATPVDRRDEFQRVKLLASKEAKNKTPACRRLPSYLVNENGEWDKKGKSVASKNKEWLTERLARAASLLVDVWVATWEEAGRPALCPILKPLPTTVPFVAPDYV